MEKYKKNDEPNKTPAPVVAAAHSSTNTQNQANLDTAWYELIAVITHKGRSADGGHYVAWVKMNDTWLKFDDDKVSPTTEEEIKKLSGGGDFHTAYDLIYKRTQQAP